MALAEATSVGPQGREPTTLKIVLLMLLFVLTFLAGLVPLGLRRAVERSGGRRRRWLRLAFALLSVFGGGVFLATCLLDLLPDAVEKIGLAMLKIDSGAAEFPLPEFLVAVGFFLVLTLEQVVLFCRESSPPAQLPRRRLPTLLNTISVEDEEAPRVEAPPPGHPDGDSAVISRGDGEAEGLVEGLDCDVHFNPDEHSTLRALVLVAALSLHATFEGLALGLLQKRQVIVEIFAALCIHKSILGFSLGLRLVQSRLKPFGMGMCVLVFAIVAPIGGAAGLAVVDEVSRRNSDLVSGALQAVACGTFLYVTAFEILPHELNEPGHRIPKLLTLFAGFATIALFVLFFPV